MLEKLFWILAALYSVVGITLGIYMSSMHDLALTPVHAHLALLGWVSQALFAAFYGKYPDASTTMFAKAHFCLHNLGLPLFVSGIALVVRGNDEYRPFIHFGIVFLLAGSILFTINLIHRLSR